MSVWEKRHALGFLNSLAILFRTPGAALLLGFLHLTAESRQCHSWVENSLPYNCVPQTGPEFQNWPLMDCTVATSSNCTVAPIKYMHLIKLPKKRGNDLCNIQSYAMTMLVFLIVLRKQLASSGLLPLKVIHLRNYCLPLYSAYLAKKWKYMNHISVCQSRWRE